MLQFIFSAIRRVLITAGLVDEYARMRRHTRKWLEKNGKKDYSAGLTYKQARARYLPT